MGLWLECRYFELGETSTPQGLQEEALWWNKADTKENVKRALNWPRFATSQ